MSNLNNKKPTSINALCIYSVADYFSLKQPIGNHGVIPFGIAYIATALLAAGHKTSLAVITADTPLFACFDQLLSEHSPRVICFSSVTSQIGLIAAAAACIKELDPEVYIVLGGHHAWLNPEESIAIEAMDAICIGEGEDAVVELADQIAIGKEPTAIQNLWFKHRKAGYIEKNQPRPFCRDLDRFPFIDRELWRSWIHDFDLQPALLIGRGCPNSCTFCSNHAMAKTTSGRYVRFRSPENVIAEIKELVSRQPDIRCIYLECETIGCNRSYTDEICAALIRFNERRSAKLTFGTNLALSKGVFDNREMLCNQLREAGFSYINVGLESGSERIRTLLRRPVYTNKDLIQFCLLSKAKGLNIHLNVIMGIPGESFEEYLETIAVTRACDPFDVQLSICSFYPGTDLYAEARIQGLVDGSFHSLSEDRRLALYDLPAFPRAVIQREFFLFPYRAFRGCWSFLKIYIRMRLEVSLYLKSLRNQNSNPLSHWIVFYPDLSIGGIFLTIACVEAQLRRTLKPYIKRILKLIP